VQYGFVADGAIRSVGDAEFDAVRFTHALLKRAAAGGGRVVERTGDGYRLTTDRGPTVSAKRVVFAVGYESGQYLKAPATTLTSTFAAVSEPMAPFPAWPDRALVWEAARPYTYLRTTPDDRVIFGGGDVPFATAHRQDDLVERKVKELLKRFAELFPGVEFEPAFTWAGTFAETADGLPYIGRPRAWPNAYFALGYGGNGITASAVAARLITDDYLGRPNPDAELFRFDRPTK
jgi:glycine/D-amino acid oxidase-like deaminating enzyme